MSENKLKVSRNNTFQFDGHVIISDKTFTINATNEKGDWIHNALNLGIDCGECGINYVNGMGGYSPIRDNVIYLQMVGEDGKFLSGDNSTKIVNWNDRLDFTEEDFKTINPQNVIRVSLEKDEKGISIQKRFISMYDAIEYIKDHLKDKDPVRVSGHIEYTPSEDGQDWYVRHVLDYIGIRQEEYLHPCAYADIMVLVDENTIGKPNVEEKTIPLYFNTLTYVRSVRGNKYNQTCIVPVKVLLDATRYDLSTELGKQSFLKMKNFFTPAKDGFVDELQIKCIYSSGVKKIEVTIDDVPTEIRKAIEAGLMFEDEVLGAMAISGNAQKELIYYTVPTINRKVVDDEGNESQTIDYIHTPSKYKNEELISFEDLEPIETSTKSITAPVDNSITLDSEEEDAGLESIMNMFAGMN